MKRKRRAGSFDGPFAPMLDLFVKQKQAIGYDYLGGYTVLRRFDLFSKAYEVKNYELTKEIVIDWNRKTPNESDTYRSARVMYLQHFAVFLNDQGYTGYVSPPQKFHHSRHSAYVFTRDEIKRIFEAADSLGCSPWSPQKHLVFPILYRMLYGCGFRISELLNLKLGNVDLTNGIVHIFDAKNGNERLVPMAGTLAERCRKFAEEAHAGHTPEYPFIFNKHGENYCVSNIQRNFRDLLWIAGIPYYGQKLGPRIHDLRHTFICHRLNQWAREDIDLMTVLPILSRYVGHTGVTSTQYYLKLTAEAFPDVKEKMESLTGKVFPEVGGDLLED